MLGGPKGENTSLLAPPHTNREQKSGERVPRIVRS